MSDSESMSENSGFFETALTALRLAAILLAIYWCYRILAPFIPLVLWGAIIAVAVYPLHLKLAAWLGNRKKLSATLITLLGLIILVTPVVILTESLVVSSMDLAEDISEGSVHVPPPPERVEKLPLVGEELYSSWQLASKDLSAAMKRFRPQLEALRGTLLATAGGAGAAFLQMLFSVIIAGFFLASAKGSLAGLRAVKKGLIGERSPRLLAMFETTIRSVAQGVLGVAIIESILAAIGLVVAGVPAAGFWTFLILVLSTVQVPPLLPLVPLTVYVLSTVEPFGATIFVVLSILVVLVDTILKPVLLGRKADSPMLIVLLGAIGGMMLWGIAGLFVGAVVLVLGWEGLNLWIMESNASATEPPRLSQEPVPSAGQE